MGVFGYKAPVTAKEGSVDNPFLTRLSLEGAITARWAKPVSGEAPAWK